MEKIIEAIDETYNNGIEIGQAYLRITKKLTEKETINLLCDLGYNIQNNNVMTVISALGQYAEANNEVMLKALLETIVGVRDANLLMLIVVNSYATNL